MNLKVPGAILPLGCESLSTRAKTIWGSCCNTPLGELGTALLKIILNYSGIVGMSDLRTEILNKASINCDP